MSDDPFRTLGITSAATPAEVRAARRDLAREHHPDAGGDAAAMQRINAAAAAALKHLADGAPTVPDTSSARSEASAAASETSNNDWVGTSRDVPSFTVEALPVETFEALLLATAQLGEVEDDDPPYVLRTLMLAPLNCWCQLDIVPDAGASTVSISIAASDGARLPSIIDVRNAWITALNELDWAQQLS